MNSRIDIVFQSILFNEMTMLSVAIAWLASVEKPSIYAIRIVVGRSIVDNAGSWSIDGAFNLFKGCEHLWRFAKRVSCTAPGVV